MVMAEKFDDSTIGFTVNGLGCDFELMSLMPIEVNICEFEACNFGSGDDVEVEEH
jgi:hypothetical protein